MDELLIFQVLDRLLVNQMDMMTTLRKAVLGDYSKAILEESIEKSDDTLRILRNTTQGR